MFNDKTPSLFANGAVGVIPTDTVYGLAARVNDKTAVAKLYQLKQREAKPGTVIASSVEQLVDLGLNAKYLVAVKKYWPGAISIVIPCDDTLRYLDQGKGSLAVRIPNDSGLRELLAATGPLVTSSANHPGLPPANTIAEAKTYFGNAVDFYIDGGNLSGHQPSTVIRLDDDKLVLLRQGAVNL
jgi:L-threonylcarbamoyladenylate synthase